MSPAGVQDADGLFDGYSALAYVRSIPDLPALMAADSSGEDEYEPIPSRRLVVFVAVLSVIAVLLAGASLAINVLRSGSTGSTDSCRALAWAALPDPSTLPAGWTLAGSGFYSDGFSTSFVGPASTSTTTASPSIYVRLNCLGADDHLALTRSREAALAAGGTAVTFAKLGDESFAIQDATGTTTVYFRRSSIVVYLVAAPSVTPSELQLSATAVDLAIATSAASGGTVAPRPTPSGGAILRTLPPSIAPVSPGPSGSAGPVVSPGSSPTHGAPELEALLPHVIKGTKFMSASLAGASAFGSDIPSTSLLASIKSFGRTASDFQVAEVYDPTNTLPDTVTAFRVAGLDALRLRQAVIASWQAVAASGMVTSPVSISGKSVIKVDYADGSSFDFVYIQGATVFDVQTADATFAAAVLALLP